MDTYAASGAVVVLPVRKADALPESVTAQDFYRGRAIVSHTPQAG